MFGVKSDIISEESPFEPVSPYALSKLACYNICKFYKTAFDLDVR